MRRLAFFRPYAWVCAAGLSALAPPADAGGFPEFEAAPCCQLCPQAADEANYNTKFLDGFKTLVQGSDGWLFRSKVDLLMQFGPTPEGLQRLARFHHALRRRGVELVLVVQPPRGLMHADKVQASGYPYDPDVAQASYERMLREVRAQGIVVPQLETLIKSRGEEDYFSRTDHHWTPDGARRSAEVVALQVRSMPQYAALKRKPFSTRREGLLPRNATLSRAAATLCGYGAPKLYLPRFVTESAGGADGDLLGDEALPEITLVGTSNSESAFNFSGYISALTNSDVLNASVIGGGMDGAILSYLGSDEFRKSPPKVLIWEMQHFHDPGESMFYRQAMPMLDDGCNGKTAIQERDIALRIGTNEALFNGGGVVSKLRGRDHVLDIQFSDPNTLEFRGVVWYTTGNKDSIRIEHSARAPSLKGRFVTGLRDDQNYRDQIFMGLDIDVAPPEIEPGSPSPKPIESLRARVRLCSKSADSFTTVAAITEARTRPDKP